LGLNTVAIAAEKLEALRVLQDGIEHRVASRRSLSVPRYVAITIDVVNLEDAPVCRPAVLAAIAEHGEHPEPESGHKFVGQVGSATYLTPRPLQPAARVEVGWLLVLLALGTPHSTNLVDEAA